MLFNAFFSLFLSFFFFFLTTTTNNTHASLFFFVMGMPCVGYSIFCFIAALNHSTMPKDDAWYEQQAKQGTLSTPTDAGIRAHDWEAWDREAEEYAQTTCSTHGEALDEGECWMCLREDHKHEDAALQYAPCCVDCGAPTEGYGDMCDACHAYYKQRRYNQGRLY